MKVEVYHNISDDASFGLNAVFEVWPGAQPGSTPVKRQGTGDERHQLVKVFEYDSPDSPGMVLEGAFHRFNVGEDELAQAYRARRLRSLSVGDVLCLGSSGAYSVESAGFSVESAGFSVRQPDELRVVTDSAEAEKLVRERYQFNQYERLSVTVPWDVSLLEDNAR